MKSMHHPQALCTQRTPTGHSTRRIRLKLLSYNIQVGIMTKRRFDYIAHGWKHLIPHTRRSDNLKSIASLIREYDIVGLQELDGGSFRTNFINQTEFLAKEAGFQCWHDQINRNMGLVAKHSLGVLSRLESSQVNRHSLPGVLPGRGVLTVQFGSPHDPLVLMLVHLSLGRKARMKQVGFLCDLIVQYDHIILMGDMNCGADGEEMNILKSRTGLKSSDCSMASYPSWNPTRRIDHILVSPSLKIEKASVLDYPLSDHLPIAMEVSLPGHLMLELPYRECRSAA